MGGELAMATGRGNGEQEREKESSMVRKNIVIILTGQTY